MSQIINKYHNAVIYAIKSHLSEKIYIGSTVQRLETRFSNHISQYKSYLNKGLNSFVRSFKIIELGDAYIEVLEECNCENRNLLEKREGELIRQHLSICVNKCIVGRTSKEYRDEHVEQIKLYRDTHIEKMKLYRFENKDQLLEKARQKNICECGLSIAKYSKSYHNKSQKHIHRLESIKIK